MRNAFRSAPLLVATAILAGCGGDSNEPNDPFPEASGVYEASGGFDEIPSSDGSFSGTLELTQASRESGALEGAAALLVELQGDIFNLSDDVISNASVSPTGVIVFTLGDAEATWTFSGTLSGDNINSGRHTLSSTSANISGSWQGSRATGNAIASREASDAISLAEMLHRFVR